MNKPSNEINRRKKHYSNLPTANIDTKASISTPSVLQYSKFN